MIPGAHSNDPTSAATGAAGASHVSFERTFAALAHRNYRLWFAGQLVSLLGTWMQSTAQAFLVYQLTRSPAYLGYVGFAGGLPSWLFMLYGGVVSDRVPRRTVLVITQSVMMLLAAVLALLAFTGWVRPWHILLLAAALGLANAFDAPSRQAFVSELVPRVHLTNAIALNSTMFNTAQAVGPAVAGITYDLFGPGWCFSINAVSFLAVIAALAAMRLDRGAIAARAGSARAELAEAIRYVAADPIVRTLVLLVGITSGFGIAVMTLLPAWAVTVLHGTARTNGLLQSARGIGALVSALAVASMAHAFLRGRLLTVGTLALPAFLLVFASGRSVAWAWLSLAAAGAALILVNNVSNALVQTGVPDRLRGRVMGIYTLTFFGMMPVGALTIGAIAEWIGLASAVRIAAAVLSGAAVLAWTLVPRLRRLP